MSHRFQNVTLPLLCGILLFGSVSALAGWQPRPWGDYLAPWPLAADKGVKSTITVKTHDRDTWINTISDADQNDNISNVKLYIVGSQSEEYGLGNLVQSIDFSPSDAVLETHAGIQYRMFTLEF